MSSYILKQSSETVYFINLRGKKVGSVYQNHAKTEWIGRIDNDQVRAASPDLAFHEIVKVKNRIALCGVNDEAKAREALDKRNARVAAEAARQQAAVREFFGDMPAELRDSMRKIGADPMDIFGPRVRKGKIAI